MINRCIHCDAEVTVEEIYEARDLSNTLFSDETSMDTVDAYTAIVLNEQFMQFGEQYADFAVADNPYGQDDMEVICVACMRTVVDSLAAMEGE